MHLREGALAVAAALAACAAAPDRAPPAAPAPVEAAAAAPVETARQPAPPYWSIQLASVGKPASAQSILATLADVPHARAERRRSGLIVRIGAWATRAEADAQLPAQRARFADARVLEIRNPADWLLAGGGTLPVPGAAAPPATASAPAPAPAAAAAPTATAPAVDFSARYREVAQDLDTEIRRWLRSAGTARRDGQRYGMDLAPLLLYAAERGDRALYLALLPDARRLILLAPDDPYTHGFVLWRRKDDAAPELSGAAETAWMARALWAGAHAFDRSEDRALALRILDGYARHAYELQNVWMIRKYFSFASRMFANLSMIPAYQPDLLAAAERATPRREWHGIAERSYALLQRAQAPAGLLYPVVQPEIGATYPGLGLDLYGPNDVTPLEDACVAAEAAVAGRPQLARSVLKFAQARAHRNRFGRVYGYFDGTRGDPVGDQPLSATGYACLAQLAAVLGDSGAWRRIEPQLLNDMEPIATLAQTQSAPLYVAGPMLRAARAAGAFSP